jgi:hypothetical protein
MPTPTAPAAVPSTPAFAPTSSSPSAASPRHRSSFTPLPSLASFAPQTSPAPGLHAVDPATPLAAASPSPLPLVVAEPGDEAPVASSAPIAIPRAPASPRGDPDFGVGHGGTQYIPLAPSPWGAAGAPAAGAVAASMPVGGAVASFNPIVALAGAGNDVVYVGRPQEESKRSYRVQMKRMQLEGALATGRGPRRERPVSAPVAGATSAPAGRFGRLSGSAGSTAGEEEEEDEDLRSQLRGVGVAGSGRRASVRFVEEEDVFGCGREEDESEESSEDELVAGGSLSDLQDGPGWGGM